MGGGSSGGGGGTTVQKTEPWEGAKPYMQDAMSEAQRLYKNSGAGRDYFPGSTVVGFSGDTNSAINMQRERAKYGTQVDAKAKSQVQNTLSGNYLENQPGMQQLYQIGSGQYLSSDPANQYLQSFASGEQLEGNPYADAMFQRMADKMHRGVAAQFTGSGRYGSGAHQRLLQEGIGNLATDFYGNIYETERQRQMDAIQGISDAYGRERGLQQEALGKMGDQFQTERGRQMQALQLAPSIANQDYVDIDRLAAVGRMQEELEADKLAERIDRFNFYEQNPYTRLAEYNAILQGYGGMGSTQVAPSANRFSRGVGGALGGAAVGSMIVPGIGTAIGAGIGGLGSMFF